MICSASKHRQCAHPQGILSTLPCLFLQIVDDHGVPLTDTAHPELANIGDSDLIGPDSKPTEDMGRAASLAVPLERQISFKFPTVITPSEQAEGLRHIDNGEEGMEQVLTAKQAAKAYAGESLLLPEQDLVGKGRTQNCRHLSLAEQKYVME